MKRRERGSGEREGGVVERMEKSGGEGEEE